MNLSLWIEQFAQDVRGGVRNLIRSPGFAVIAAGSLALGIGASTAMYSVIFGVIIDPFPYKDVDRLASILVNNTQGRGGRTYYNVDQYVEFARRSGIFEGVVASTISDVIWTGNGEPQRLRGNVGSFNTFDVMGVPPLLGRTTVPADEAPGAEPVTVLGYKFWQLQLGGDSSVLGRKLLLNGKMRTVIGVMPKRFMWRGADVYLPVTFRHGETSEGVRDVHVLGRVRAGVTAAQAEGDLRPIVEELQRRDRSQFPEKWRVSLVPFKETFPSGITEALWILFGAVGLLLVIACVNVSNLLLTRAAARQREIAVRASLGATRWRLIRQLLAENLALTAAGGLLGIAFAYAALRGILAAVPPNTIPDESDVTLSVPVLWFAMGVSIVCSLISGLAPALHSSGRDFATPLKEAGRSGTGGRTQNLIRAVLVGGEIALSLMLLVGAALMIRTLFAKQGMDLSFRPDHILTMRIPLSDQRYPDASRRVAFLQEVLRGVETVPGVVACAVNTSVHPLGNMGASVEVPGNAQQDSRRALIHQVSAGYMKTMGIALSAGRLLTESEVASRAHVAVVNRAFVTRYFSGGEAIGRMVRVPRLRAAPVRLADDSFQIAGVVRDTANNVFSSDEVLMPEIYIPYTHAGMANELIVSGQINPSGLANALRAKVYAVDKDQPVTDVKTVEELLTTWVYSTPRFNVFLFSVFAAIGLTLALFGVYGVVSNAVAQRTREIGIRMALGAAFPAVIRLVLGSGLRLLALGMGAGLLASLIGVRVLANQVWKLSTLDPYSFGAVAALLLFTGLVACFVPATRAARLDPLRALRHD